MTSSNVTCVMLGVAEVKAPLRRLPPYMRVHVAMVAHRAVLSPDHPSEKISEENEEQQQFIGVIDGYYALSEVVVQIQDDMCEVKKGQEVVLKHKVKDVIIIMNIREITTRIVYICRNDSFGRAAVILQMRTCDEVEKILSFFPDAVPDSLGPPIPSNELQAQSQKDAKSSWSRGVGKKFTSMFASLSTGPKKSPKSGSKSTTPETPEPPTPDTDTDDDDLESTSDDTDSQSEGKYYEEMGLDANVQESLYDDALETASRASDSYPERNAAAVEFELRFLMESDIEFVKNIQSLEDDRDLLAGPNTPQFIREKLTLLFMQVKSVIRLHTELYNEFVKSGTSITLFCEAIINHRADYDSYVYFMENIPTVDEIIQNHWDYFRVQMPNLPEKLRKPRMRLHYYVLTLETILKKCSSSSDKQIIHQAIEVLKEPLKKADSKLFLSAVTGCPFDVSDLGNLIRHSDLQLRKGGDLAHRTYHVLLLNSLLILTISRGRYYQYVTSFRMDQVGIGKQARGLMFTLDVRNGPRGSSVAHIFKAKNINLQQHWMNALRELLITNSQLAKPGEGKAEKELEVNQSMRRSKVRRGHSFERTIKKLISPTTPSDSDDLEEDRPPLLGRSVSDGSAFSTILKKTSIMKKSNSSMTARNKPLARQPSNLPSPNRSSVNWKNLERLPPLTIESVFPELERIYTIEQEPVEVNKNLSSYIEAIENSEHDFVKGLNEQLGTFLNEDYSKPPSCIINHLRNIFSFHSLHFSPILQAACSSRIPEDIATCFKENAEPFKEIYSAFLADRARYDEQMQEMDLHNPYVFPVLHFATCLRNLYKLQKHAIHKNTNVISDAIGIFRQCITEANTILLTETIYGAPFDLDECGPVLHQGKIKVRQSGYMLKQDMYVVLLNTLILLLEPRIPYYNYMNSIRMDTVGMGPSADPCSFQLEVRTEATKTLTYHFKAPTKESKEKWESAITKLLNKQVELMKERLKKRLGDDDGKMKYIEMKGDNDLHRVYPRRLPLETSL